MAPGFHDLWLNSDHKPKSGLNVAKDINDLRPVWNTPDTVHHLLRRAFLNSLALCWTFLSQLTYYVKSIAGRNNWKQMLQNIRGNTKYLISFSSSFISRRRAKDIWTREIFFPTVCFATAELPVTSQDLAQSWCTKICFYLQCHLLWSHWDRCVCLCSSILTGARNEELQTDHSSDREMVPQRAANAEWRLDKQHRFFRHSRPANRHDRSQTVLHRVCIIF